MKKFNILQLIVLDMFSLGVSILSQSLLAVWIPSASNPPSKIIGTPINSGIPPQSKLRVSRNAFFTQNVVAKGIIDTGPITSFTSGT